MSRISFVARLIAVKVDKARVSAAAAVIDSNVLLNVCAFAPSVSLTVSVCVTERRSALQHSRVKGKVLLCICAQQGFKPGGKRGF